MFMLKLRWRCYARLMRVYLNDTNKIADDMKLMNFNFVRGIFEGVW